MAHMRVLGCFAAGVLLATAPRSAVAYRTAADLPDFTGTERVRWPVDTIHYETAAWLPSGLDPASVQQAVAAGFTPWATLACPTITFIDDGTTPGVAAPGDGRITVQWIGQDWTTLGFDPTAAASTDVLYELQPSGVWRITDADIFLRADGTFTWSTSGTDPTTRDVQAVVTHEVGHALGLLHPCEPSGVEGAPTCGPEHAGLCMHPEYSITQRALLPDDVAGACFLYEPLACATDGCPGGESCTIEGCAASCDGITCAVGERCGPAGCTPDPCVPGSCERGCDDTCQTPGGANGDPCTSDLDCYIGHCSTGGYCAPLCDGNLCPDGFLCDPARSPVECVAADAVFGVACGHGSECLSGFCLLEDGLPKMCTRECGGDFRSCPDGYSCEPVDGLDVCVPPGNSGCSVARTPRQPHAWLLLLAATFLLARRLHRRG